MKITASMVLFVFMAMALFSFVGIANDHQGIGECIASTIQGGACPEGSSLFELVSFHTGAFSAFSLAIVASFAALFVIAAAYLFASFLAALLSSVRLPQAVFAVPQDFPAYRKYIRALARYERSPTA